MYGHKYTPEERAFFLEYVPGHTYKEIQAEFTRRFEWEIQISQVKGYMANHRINNGLTGRFIKGQVSHNKGKKGVCAAGSEKGWFHEGHMPHNHKPVGSERISKDGYWEVKIAEPKKWRMKHVLVWEQHNGPIPRGMCVIFLDGDKNNLSIDNLRMISRADLARMNQNGLFSGIAEVTEAGMHLAALMTETGKRRKNGKCKYLADHEKQ